MRLREFTIDNESGLGATPNNNNVDYLGLRVEMTTKTFLSLAQYLDFESEPVDKLKAKIEDGTPIASPFLIIDIPKEWEEGNMTKTARVWSHEGRHRMYAIYELEGNIPVETHLFFTHGLRARHIKPDWIANINRKLINQDGKPVYGPFFKLVSI